jgi:hypothetical protein
MNMRGVVSVDFRLYLELAVKQPLRRPGCFLEERQRFAAALKSGEPRPKLGSSRRSSRIMISLICSA